MKFVKLKLKNGQWDAQYTQELDGYITRDQFISTVYLLNGAIARASPPLLNLKWWRAGIVSIWIIVAAISAIIWYYTAFTMIIALEPAVMVCSSMVYMTVYHKKTTAFELSMEDMCDRLNATENVRGIRFAFHRSMLSSSDNVLQWTGGGTASYHVMIEFDDRYNMLEKFGKISCDELVNVPYHPQWMLMHEEGINENRRETEENSGG
ncbi:hypothetical protein BGW37DRAFT_538941 [Umbelopsis sp. PMI_123]|nr:hypothetical protein BGW37DRAFT_538941 [Umbelopsis sp. PMI_123]